MTDVPLRDAAQAPTDEIERIRARATAADYEPTAEDIELCQSGECGGCFVCYGRPMLMFGESDVRLLLAEIARLRAALAAADATPVLVYRITGDPEALAEAKETLDVYVGNGVEDFNCTDPRGVTLTTELTADGTTPTQPDEVLWEGPAEELDAVAAAGTWAALGVAPDRRVRVVATPATEQT